MSERNGTSSGTNTAEIPVVRPPTGPAGPTVGEPSPPPAGSSAVPVEVDEIEPGGDPHATAPVTVRPAPRLPRRGPLTVMGPWAPVAGGVLGLLIGLIGVLFLADSAESFEDRLALLFAVVGLGSLGVAGTLLADEVRMVRQGTRDAAVRPAWAEVSLGLLTGLTPARLLLVVSAFVLFLAAYVSRG
jgi:hypothetical protein